MTIRAWTHNTFGAKTREEAIEQMHSYYDAHPGKRRKTSKESFEVYLVRKNPLGFFVLYVRRRRRHRRGVKVQQNVK